MEIELNHPKLEKPIFFKDEPLKELKSEYTYDNICVLKCPEPFLVKNIKLLCKNKIQFVPGFQGFFAKDNYFYFVIADRNTVEDIGLKGWILK